MKRLGNASLLIVSNILEKSNFQQHSERLFDSQISQNITAATMSHIGRLKSRLKKIPIIASMVRS